MRNGPAIEGPRWFDEVDTGGGPSLLRRLWSSNGQIARGNAIIRQPSSGGEARVLHHAIVIHQGSRTRTERIIVLLPSWLLSGLGPVSGAAYQVPFSWTTLCEAARKSF
jgi:hypothetical protein